MEKLQTIVSTSPEVIYQIANLNELMGSSKIALKWYQVLLNQLSQSNKGLVLTDSSILAPMGAIYTKVELSLFLYILLSV